MDICYFCGEQAFSDEHAPPKSFFPKGMRDQLITVRSCPLHNNKKSKDDEYVRLFVIGANMGNLEAKEKVQEIAIRGIERKHSLGFDILNNADLIDDEIAVDFEYARFESFFDSLARAIYFHHFGVRVESKLEVYILDIKFDDLELQDFSRIITKECNVRFNGLEKFGCNQDVFYYQITHDNKAFKFVFYDEFSVYATLS